MEAGRFEHGANSSLKDLTLSVNSRGDVGQMPDFAPDDLQIFIFDIHLPTYLPADLPKTLRLRSCSRPRLRKTHTLRQVEIDVPKDMPDRFRKAILESDKWGQFLKQELSSQYAATRADAKDLGEKVENPRLTFSFTGKLPTSPGLDLLLRG
ncbi:hypothetical protein RUM44_012542 [Polyplax serrata]|uniref:Uncharacterized protein n=1 Tax=Polyplax serrata TaxID=468196 RepID=A0ABR1BFE0_POLSC